MKRLGSSIGALFLLAILGSAGWYFVSPLFLNRTVDEELPFALPSAIAAGAHTSEAVATLQFPDDSEIGMILPPITVLSEVMPTAEAPLTETATAEVVTALTATAVPTARETAGANDEDSTNLPVVISQGEFADADSFHKGSGVATLYQTADGSFLLRFDDFAATNGPDLHVVLSPNAHPADHDGLGDYLDLGPLKGNIGDQNYALPSDFDSSLYKSVVIYCLPFQVIFATATLE